MEWNGENHDPGARDYAVVVGFKWMVATRMSSSVTHCSTLGPSIGLVYFLLFYLAADYRLHKSGYAV